MSAADRGRAYSDPYQLEVIPRSNTFVQLAFSGNLAGSSTILDNALTNDRLAAMVFVTAREYNGGLNELNLTVWYHNSRWNIADEDGSPMAANTVYNVFVIELRRLFLPILRR